MHNEPWINDAIRHGLVKLLSLRLRGCPPDDVIELTARTWLETIAEGRQWEQARDEDRFRVAFVILARTCETWPAPKHFLDALPPVPPPLALAKEHRPANPLQRAAAIEKIRTMLSATVQPIPAARVERDTTPEQRERIEGDLRARYAGKMTAAGPDA